ncbi:hypothetical protein GCM10011511_00200 [Puia dinghuensis]|uniref:Aldehyde dehydrogenase domain-containing protein n=2 Tax=Puia dinghuensis TaxID=1792502 RepID=A0A8J2U603_9BACT|nr:hypothetical protein GCM10011511_00200 [Puia dinghuensis]
MKDADLEKAVADAVTCGMLNGGQSCSAIERYFVHRDIEKEFIGRLVDRLNRLKAGYAEDEETEVGPISSPTVLGRMIEQVQDARQKGATVVCGGMPIEIGMGKMGFRPTVIQGCTTAMQVIQQETFGPFFPILSFSSEAELISKVDDCAYGLNASIYGETSNWFNKYMDNNHRNLYFNSTVTSPVNRYSRIIDGGFRNSGFVWEWEDSSFIQREGKRLLLKELSVTVI